WRGFLGPRRLTIGHDDEEIDGATFAIDEPAQTAADVGAPAAAHLQPPRIQPPLPPGHHDAAAGDDDLRAVAELPCQSAELGDGSRQLRVLHGSRGIDQKTRSWPRLVKRRHQELAIARLPTMGSLVSGVVAAKC